MYNQREKTKFHGLTIVHPHSGKVSRSEIATVVKHLANGYNNESDKQNADNLIKYGNDVIVLEDSNNTIKGRAVVSGIESLY